MNKSNTEIHSWLIFDPKNVTFNTEDEIKGLFVTMLCPSKGIICKAVLMQCDENDSYVVFLHHSTKRIDKADINRCTSDKKVTKSPQKKEFYSQVMQNLEEDERLLGEEIWYTPRKSTIQSIDSPENNSKLH